VAKFEFPVPESMVQSQIDTRLGAGLRALAAQGMRTEDMRKRIFDRLREAQREIGGKRGERDAGSWIVLPMWKT